MNTLTVEQFIKLLQETKQHRWDLNPEVHTLYAWDLEFKVKINNKNIQSLLSETS